MGFSSWAGGRNLHDNVFCASGCQELEDKGNKGFVRGNDCACGHRNGHVAYIRDPYKRPADNSCKCSEPDTDNNYACYKDKVWVKIRILEHLYRLFPAFFLFLHIL